jgi:hypothetical protein
LRLRDHFRDQKGGAAVEFALVIPVLVLFLFGIVEFSLGLYDKAVLTNAGREGARAGIVFRYDPVNEIYAPLTEEEIGEIVDDYLQDRLINFTEDPPDHVTTVEYEDLDLSGDLSSGDYRLVTVTYMYQYLVLPNFVGSLIGGLNLTAMTKMRME